jgi:hypothetical protein
MILDKNIKTPWKDQQMGHVSNRCGSNIQIISLEQEIQKNFLAKRLILYTQVTDMCYHLLWAFIKSKAGSPQCEQTASFKTQLQVRKAACLARPWRPGAPHAASFNAHSD